MTRATNRRKRVRQQDDYARPSSRSRHRLAVQSSQFCQIGSKNPLALP